MKDPFGYFSGRSDHLVDTIDNTVDSSTIADGSTGYGNIATPSTTTDTHDLPLDCGHAANASLQNRPVSSVALHHPTGMPLSSEPTVLLAEMQNAAEDLIKRFEKPISFNDEAPLLWWLWDALLEWYTPSFGSRGSTLDFTPARRTDIFLPYTISIKLWSTGDGVDCMELTAAYGGDFMERRMFDAPIARFHFPETGFDRTTAVLSIDQPPYNKDGCFKDAFDYLMPRSGNIWRSAMNIFPAEEKRLVQAVAKTCKANDDYMYMSEDNNSQCEKLIQRFPPVARKFIEDGGLVGKKHGPYSRSANGPPGPKD
ncbi:uncharacterized protein N7511_008496 [Penicillium nucicola]|uniref:uncharacterized protein n=1 Tax=Penicillium nucicola TaxID=1850975 RepID=UPI00254566A7|nr:uncharacterized protein N7511_008496 [Penicillium nucicola]KAJ5751531.1 hypothetical protein N7511_008496 [Penicillium nucicola]